MSTRSSLVLVLLAALAPAAVGISSCSGAAAVRAAAPVAAARAQLPVACSGNQLPTAPIRAPRRIKGDAPAGSNLDPRRKTKFGGSSSPKGKAAIAARPQGKSAQVRELQRLLITGGSARGRKLVTPGVYMRPMMSRVREALFSLLYPTGVLRDSARHLDLFAGSGVVGLESLSRGVGDATFVDFSKVCCDAIRSNAETIGVGERARVVETRVDTFLADPARYGIDQPFDLIAVTPPYEEVVYAELVEQIAASPAVGEDTLVVIEYPVELGCFPPTLADGRLIGLRNRRYGRTVLAIYVNRPSGKLEYEPHARPSDAGPHLCRMLTIVPTCRLSLRSYPPFSEEFVSLSKK